MAHLGGSMAKELSSTSTSLLRMARKGEEASWTRLVNEYGPRIFRWCQRDGLENTDAADVVQDVFIAIASHLDRFRRDRDGDSFRKWIRAITTNKIRDYWRMRQRAGLPVGGSSWQYWMSHVLSEVWESSSSASGEKITDDARSHAIEQVRSEVSVRDWAIFETLMMEELSPQVVAAQFGTTVNVVYLVKSRILRQVRSLVEIGASVATADQ